METKKIDPIMQHKIAMAAISAMVKISHNKEVEKCQKQLVKS